MTMTPNLPGDTDQLTDTHERVRDALMEDLAQQSAQLVACRQTMDQLTGQSDVDSILEREVAETSAASAEAAIADAEEALERIEAGTYGICEKCGSPIPVERLEALPHARNCATCPSHRTGLFG